jgi:hypothetical protein
MPGARMNAGLILCGGLRLLTAKPLSSSLNALSAAERSSPLAARCGQPLHATTPLPAVKVEPAARALRRAPDGTPLTTAFGVVRLAHARTPPQKA